MLIQNQGDLLPIAYKGYIVLSEAQQLHTSQRMADRICVGGPNNLPDLASPAGHTNMQLTEAAIDPACIDDNEPRVLVRLNQDAVDDISCSWKASQGDMGQACAAESVGATVVIQSPLVRKPTGSDVRTCRRRSDIPVWEQYALYRRIETQLNCM